MLLNEGSKAMNESGTSGIQSEGRVTTKNRRKERRWGWVVQYRQILKANMSV